MERKDNDRDVESGFISHEVEKRGRFPLWLMKPEKLVRCERYPGADGGLVGTPLRRSARVSSLPHQWNEQKHTWNFCPLPYDCSSVALLEPLAS